VTGQDTREYSQRGTAVTAIEWTAGRCEFSSARENELLTLLFNGNAKFLKTGNGRGAITRGGEI
jgi:hypothetical protein